MRLAGRRDILNVHKADEISGRDRGKIRRRSGVKISRRLTRKEDIGPDHATIVRKGGRLLKVPLTPEVRTALLARAHSSGHIFGLDLRGGQPPTQATVSMDFRRLMKRIGLPGVSHHVLRHTGTSAMVAAGVSLRVVQEIGGWTSLRMLERYAHPTGEEKRQAVRVLSTATNAATAPSGLLDSVPQKRA